MRVLGREVKGGEVEGRAIEKDRESGREKEREREDKEKDYYTSKCVKKLKKICQDEFEFLW